MQIKFHFQKYVNNLLKIYSILLETLHVSLYNHTCSEKEHQN